MTAVFFFVSSTIVLLVGVLLGWVYAHYTVATECERLGAFYVGSKVYECKLKESKQ